MNVAAGIIDQMVTGVMDQIREQAKTLIEEQGQEFLEHAIESIGVALGQLYGNQEISLQQLSATFRREDLIEKRINGNETRSESDYV